jgi:hypothetical protein
MTRCGSTVRSSCALLLLVAAAAGGESATPPKGAPWKTDLLAAQKEALERGKPVFFYFTKTY